MEERQTEANSNVNYQKVHFEETMAAVVTSQQGNKLPRDLQDVPFARAKIGPFFQEMPQLGNQFTEDVTLVKYLKRHMPEDVYNEISPDLERFGHRVATDILQLHRECERNPPRLEHYNAWGRRVDQIITCPAWKQMKVIAAEEGLVAIAYERKYERWSRLYQMAKNYLFNASGGLFGCPISMTDGAAKTIEMLGLKNEMQSVFTHLTSRDPKEFWTSGQWMTERKGGSDVARGTQTVAVKQADGSYRLYGYKWFSSATDSDIALTLARPTRSDDIHSTQDGTQGLATFFLNVRDLNGDLNNIEVHRLKDKLGTRQLPTAELLLDGTVARKLSEDGRGVAGMTSMLTITRIRNAMGACAGMRRIINLARDYSTKRVCFNKLIKDHPLHVKNLANMEIEARASLLLILELCRLLGLDDCNVISDTDRDILRLITPVAKLYVAKQAMSVTSEGLECFGGMGYLEDTGLPQILRDAQVTPIWEGTTNVLSLDVLRAISKSQGSVLRSFLKEIIQRTAPVQQNPALQAAAKAVSDAAQSTVRFAQEHGRELEIAARQFAFSLARTYMGLLLLEHANWKHSSADDTLAAVRWCQQDLCPVQTELSRGNYNQGQAAAETDLVFHSRL